MGKKLDVKGKARRLLKRDDLRRAEATRFSDQRAWLEEGARQAGKRKELAQQRREEIRDAKEEGNSEPKQSRDLEESPTGVSVVAGRTVTGNYQDRRARGARGKQRPLRRREMPGAIERRIERNRKGWA